MMEMYIVYFMFLHTLASIMTSPHFPIHQHSLHIPKPSHSQVYYETYSSLQVGFNVPNLDVNALKAGFLCIVLNAISLALEKCQVHSRCPVSIH